MKIVEVQLFIEVNRGKSCDLFFSNLFRQLNWCLLKVCNLQWQVYKAIIQQRNKMKIKP